MATYEALTILDFQNKFNTEEKCRKHLFHIKWPYGFICPQCGNTTYYPIEKRKLYECKACKHQTSVTAGTVLHRSHIALHKWFWAIYFVAHDKRGISATRLAVELNLSYQAAWLMLHKIRKAMMDCDAHYQLTGIIALDEIYFGTPIEGVTRICSRDIIPVVAGVSLDKQGRPQYIKMDVVESTIKTNQSQGLADFVDKHIASGSTINSAAYRAYMQAVTSGKYPSGPLLLYDKKNPDQLQWLNTMISNAKACIAGTYHGLGTKHLSAYLSEFCFRTNRRRVAPELFNRLLYACTTTVTITYQQLIVRNIPGLT
ncbi:MAG: IS1595 family transposase [Treponema sp.]|jgi:transposase-like protein|nr:IS1595 family transposase [Treponema sp.]